MRASLTITCCALLTACGRPAPDPDAGLGLSDILGDADVAGFERAIEIRPFEFPADHAAHPRFKTEWWYFTGNVESLAGDAFGFQLTFFRFALTPSEVERVGWQSHAVWMGHLAVTDIERGDFYSAERFSRDGLDLAGNTRDPFGLWLEDWSAHGASQNPFPLSLSAADADFGLALRLEDEKGPVPQGDRGLDRKGAETGNASYYYSMPHLSATGEIRLGEATHEVAGSAWMDREWSSNALESTLAGWDWVALQLSDRSELMLYRLRTRDGRSSPFSSGALIGPERTTTLANEAFEMRPTGYWTSPDTGSRYPVRWSIRIPSEELELDVAAAIDNQEMTLAVRYWEGAVLARGERRGNAVSGRGYLELTGY